MRFLKSGVLDGDDIFEGDDIRPKAEQFTARRPSWLCAIAGIPQSEGQQSAKQSKDMISELEAKKATSETTRPLGQKS